MRLPNAKFAGLFSNQIKGCVAAVAYSRGNKWLILDTDKKLLGNRAALFTCDSGGVNNVILEKARKFKGQNLQKHYRAFLDDGKGGVAKRIRVSSTWYSARDCRKAFDKKIPELRCGGRIDK